MKKYLLLVPVLLVSCAEFHDTLPEKILEGISEPAFPDREYSVIEFGAVSDGMTDCRDAINEAIDQCSNEGGGRVIVPEGKFYSAGSIVLKSGVNLVLSEGCEILFSSNPEDYLPPVLTVWEGTELFNYSPLVYAYHASDIAITGKGILNGRASLEFAKMRPQKSSCQDRLRQMGIDQVPVMDRCFGKESILPPSMVQPFGCSDILIEGIRLIDSPYWVIHPVFCDNVTVRDVEIESYNLNNDGCDPEYSTNVLIERCTFNVGDDAVAIKAGRDQDGWRIGRPTKNIIIRNCTFNSLCNGLCIGSEMSAGVENVVMENVKIGKCLSGIYFKSNLDRGGFIRNVHVRNIVCDSVKTALVRFETNYHGGREGFHPTDFSDFVIEDVLCAYSGECGFYAVGTEGYNIRNVILKNVSLKEVPEPYIMRNAEDIVFKNVSMNGKKLQEIPRKTSSTVLETF